MTKTNLHASNKHGAQQILEQRFGLLRINHEAHKKSRRPGEVSPYAYWDGTLTYRTSEPVLDETEITNTFEVLLLSGYLVTFGKAFQLDGVKFHWGTEEKHDPHLGTIYEDYTTVTVKYTADLIRLDNEEAVRRLQDLGLEPSGRYKGVG